MIAELLRKVGVTAAFVSVVGRIRLMIKLGMGTLCRATAGAWLLYQGGKMGSVVNPRLR